MSPSILAGDLGNARSVIAKIEEEGIPAVHFDVMDGQFVPNLTFGAPFIQSLREESGLFFDVHLMIETPSERFTDFKKAGADLLIIHAEAAPHPGEDLKRIRDLEMFSGIALNPRTPLSTVEPFVDSCDYLLIMSVNPGFYGQKFIPATMDKLTQAAKLKEKFPNLKIGIDGGVNGDNLDLVARAGADLVVSGSFAFKGDMRKIQATLRGAG